MVRIEPRVGLTFGLRRKQGLQQGHRKGELKIADTVDPCVLEASQPWNLHIGHSLVMTYRQGVGCWRMLLALVMGSSDEIIRPCVPWEALA